MSTENVAASGFGAETEDRGKRVLGALASTGTIFVLLLILWVWITILNPTFAEPGPFLAYLKRSAPLVILAAGAYFVLVSGNFDLSVVKSFEPVEFGRAISSETADALKKMMVADVDDGAASNARIDGVSVGGKTGTAENIGADGEEDPYTLWFTGFAPAEDTKYAITVLIEDGGGMGTDGYGNLLAAPVAQKVLEAVLNK